MHDTDSPRRLRVLLVPDHKRWVMGAKARAIADWNPWIDATICSEAVLRDRFHGGADLIGSIDLIHFMWERSFLRLGRHFLGRVPTVVIVPHVEEEAECRHAAEADAVVYVSNEWRDELIHLGVPAERLHHMPNGADTDAFRPATAGERDALRKDLGIPADAFVVGFVAKRSSDTNGRKGIGAFIDAMRGLAADVPNICALIIGPGWSDSARDLERAGLRVVYAGFVGDAATLARHYRSMDLFWSMALREGGPATLLEAMASGVCPLATPTGMALDIIRDGENGFVAPFGDANAFRRISADLARDGARRERISLAARSTIVDRYQWRSTTRAVADIYASAIRRFAARTASPPRDDLLSAIDPSLPASLRPSDDYLSAVPERLRRSTLLAEEFNWSLHLLHMREPLASLRHAIGTGLLSPSGWPSAVRSISDHATERLFDQKRNCD